MNMENIIETRNLTKIYKRYVKKEGAYNIMGKFVIRTTATGFTFRLKARNGEVIATSEVYNSRSACLNGVESVRKNAADATVEEEEG